MSCSISLKELSNETRTAIVPDLLSVIFRVQQHLIEEDLSPVPEVRTGGTPLPCYCQFVFFLPLIFVILARKRSMIQKICFALERSLPMCVDSKEKLNVTGHMPLSCSPAKQYMAIFLLPYTIRQVNPILLSLSLSLFIMLLQSLLLDNISLSHTAPDLTHSIVNVSLSLSLFRSISFQG